MAVTTRRHRVFISFHEHDIQYKKTFVRMMGERIVDRSAGTGDIDDGGLKTDAIRLTIRDLYIRDATVTIVLVGPQTWQRKHVDLEMRHCMPCREFTTSRWQVEARQHHNRKEKVMHVRTPSISWGRSPSPGPRGFSSVLHDLRRD